MVRLAQREAACCPFFSFAIAIRADGPVLVVEVPERAIEILDEFVSEVFCAHDPLTSLTLWCKLR